MGTSPPPSGRSSRSSARICAGLRELFRPSPTATRSALGNGGATAFLGWRLRFGLIRERSLHLAFGEFSPEVRDKSARGRAPFSGPRPVVIAAEPGDAPDPALVGPQARRRRRRRDRVGPHNENLHRRNDSRGPTRGARGDALVLIDATSGAGWSSGRREPRLTPTTSRRRSASPPTAALWLALLSPAAQERIGALDASLSAGSRRFLSLQTALENSLKDQTYNTPACRDACFLLADQIGWMLGLGGP